LFVNAKFSAEGFSIVYDVNGLTPPHKIYQVKMRKARFVFSSPARLNILAGSLRIIGEYHACSSANRFIRTVSKVINRELPTAALRRRSSSDGSVIVNATDKQNDEQAAPSVNSPFTFADIYKAALKDGDASAQTALGECYYYGRASELTMRKLLACLK
jgi:hypothetical protein